MRKSPKKGIPSKLWNPSVLRKIKRTQDRILRHAIRGKHRHPDIRLVNVVAVPVGDGANINADNPADGVDYTTSTNSVFPPSWAGGPTVDDVNQWGLDDCFFLVWLMNLASDDGGDAFLKATLQPATGVTGIPYRNRWWAFFRRDGLLVREELDTTLAAQQSQTGTSGTIWVSVLEKAYAIFKGGFAGINGGFVQQSAADLGLSIVIPGFGQDSLTMMPTWMSQGRKMVACTSANRARADMVLRHAYMVESSYPPKIRLRNPWGKNSQPAGKALEPEMTVEEFKYWWMSAYAVEKPVVPADLPKPAKFPDKPPLPNGVKP